MDTKKEIIFVFAIILCILLFLVGYIIYFVTLYQRRKRRNYQEQEQLKNHFHQELLRTQLEIQEQTFKNISQEIHDNIGQILSLVKLTIRTINPQDPTDVQAKMADTDGLVGKAIQDLRDLSKSLNTDFISNMGLVKAISYELERVKKLAALRIELHVEGAPFPLPAQQELILFRMFQEVLNNILKHAKASAIVLHFYYQTDQFTLRIRDDGQGFNPGSSSETKQARGLGIRNMQSRAQLIHAGFAIESHVGNGTSVTITLPMENRRAL